MSNEDRFLILFATTCVYGYIIWTKWCCYLLSIKDDEHEKNIPKKRKKYVTKFYTWV